MKILIGIMQTPCYNLYWSQELGYPLLSDAMPLKRYEQFDAFSMLLIMILFLIKRQTN